MKLLYHDPYKLSCSGAWFSYKYKEASATQNT